MMTEDQEERGQRPRLREPVVLPTVGSAGGGGQRLLIPLAGRGGGKRNRELGELEGGEGRERHTWWCGACSRRLLNVQSKKLSLSPNVLSSVQERRK